MASYHLFFPLETTFTQDEIPVKLRLPDKQKTGPDIQKLLKWFVALQHQALKPLAALALMITMQGCVTYTPEFSEDNGFREVETELSGSDISQRRVAINLLLSNPTKSTKTPVLQSGIESFQRRRISKHFEDLMEEVCEEDFQKYLALCWQARDTLGIMNPDRYSPNLLRVAVENYTQPEKEPEKPVVLALIQRSDEERVFGIQPLNADTHRLEELTRAYKVIIVETEELSEILVHLRHLEEKGILKAGNLHGVIVGAHGERTSTGNGLSTSNLNQLSQLQYFLSENSYFIWACCNGAKSETEEIKQGDDVQVREYDVDSSENLANASTLLFPNTTTFACNDVLEALEFDLDENDGSFLPHSLQLLNLWDYVLPGNSTHQPNRAQVLQARTQRVYEYMTHKAPIDFVRESVGLGIVSAVTICELKKRNLPPVRYALYQRRFSERDEIFSLVDKGISPQLMEGYYQIGARYSSQMIHFHEHSISPAQIAHLQQTARSLNMDDIASQIEFIRNLTVVNAIPYEVVENFYDKSIFDLGIIVSCFRRGQSADQYCIARNLLPTAYAGTR